MIDPRRPRLPTFLNFLWSKTHTHHAIAGADEHLTNPSTLYYQLQAPHKTSTFPTHPTIMQAPTNTKFSNSHTHFYTIHLLEAVTPSIYPSFRRRSISRRTRNSFDSHNLAIRTKTMSRLRLQPSRGKQMEGISWVYSRPFTCNKTLLLNGQAKGTETGRVADMPTKEYQWTCKVCEGNHPDRNADARKRNKGYR
ncbi:hypothetical protein CC80DRAFT_58459 [Byssothecium circinans]|uniref:Uncharacterized protein n=1 Tax=Byssothecium circinans TaxID=147558 RepID=A0A6A5U5S5_9PLEO|nr:hypothetical protein CC80DRAFT_58459 [Byssothecium circinans]